MVPMYIYIISRADSNIQYKTIFNYNHTNIGINQEEEI